MLTDDEESDEQPELEVIVAEQPSSKTTWNKSTRILLGSSKIEGASGSKGYPTRI